MEFLEKIEYDGKIIRGRIIKNKVWIVANDITDLFGYKNGRNAVRRAVNEKNVLKYPVFWTNGNQCNLINISGINEILQVKKKNIDESEKKENLKAIQYAVEYLKRKRDYLELEEYFIRFQKEKMDEYKIIKSEKKKSFWRKMLELLGI